MSELVLPHTIDAGTEIVAVEHQANYTAIRDIINGELEGGSGSDGNLKAKGITARELDAAALKYAGVTALLQPGVFDSGDLKVTPGSGLQLNYAAGRAFITDDGTVHTSGILLPANVASGSTVTVAANATGNPRIDQVIVTLTGLDAGTVSVLQGTATSGATLNNRSGAASLPSNAVRLADILMPNGFAGPFVAGTHIRDRRPWARGLRARGTDSTTRTQAGGATQDAITLRVECSGAPIIVTARFGRLYIGGGVPSYGIHKRVVAETGGATSIIEPHGQDLDYVIVDGSSFDRRTAWETSHTFLWEPSAGTYSVSLRYVLDNAGVGGQEMYGPNELILREYPGGLANNS